MWYPWTLKDTYCNLRRGYGGASFSGFAEECGGGDDSYIEPYSSLTASTINPLCRNPVIRHS